MPVERIIESEELYGELTTQGYRLNPRLTERVYATCPECGSKNIHRYTFQLSAYRPARFEVACDECGSVLTDKATAS